MEDLRLCHVRDLKEGSGKTYSDCYQARDVTEMSTLTNYINCDTNLSNLRQLNLIYNLYHLESI